MTMLLLMMSMTIMMMMSMTMIKMMMTMVTMTKKIRMMMTKMNSYEDDNLNCLENGEHGKGVETLANDCHHIRVVSICPYVVLLVIFKCFS